MRSRPSDFMALSALRPFLLLALAALQIGCWSKPPDGAFTCEVDDDCPSGTRCLPTPPDGRLACLKGSTSPSTPPDAGGSDEPCRGDDCESEGGAPTPVDDGGGPTTPPTEAGTDPATDAGPTSDAGPDAGSDAGTDAATDAGSDASKPPCTATEALTQTDKCGNCNLGTKTRQRSFSATTCTYSEWGPYGDCVDKTQCKGGTVQQGMKEPCGTCNKGSRTPTRTCDAKTCTWGAFTSPACDEPKNVCLPMNAGGKGWRCCSMGKWEWCYNRGEKDECTWTGGCETCAGCGC